MYFIKSPWWLRRYYSSLVWHLPTNDKVVYLTFDDGPHPTITPFVLDVLKEYNASATFFCIGRNVRTNMDVYRRIIDERHAIGNHTNDHVNGWKTADDVYIDNVVKAKQVIDSKLFRPPYGRISGFQIQQLKSIFKIVMWDVLSADFDTKISPQECLKNVVQNVRAGSIVVFHDSEKAFPRLQYALPKTLQFLKEQGYTFKAITA
jgi:peptidoglycan/xylan/chitin deacetylase (PgdA/CDA1 family)